MTKDEYMILRSFICGSHNCIDCPLDRYVPCDEVTPEKEMLFYARKESAERAGLKVRRIIGKLSKAVVT